MSSFEQFLSDSNSSISIIGYSINIVLAGIFSIFLKWIYTNYGNSLSNREAFGKNFFLITMTTSLVIAIVKSSLALSLGLVGALSIIRFRAAIKEPEELAYLFLAIAIGLGFGSGQTLITAISIFIISISIISYKRYFTLNDFNSLQNANMIIRSYKKKSINVDGIIKELEMHTTFIKLKRLDESSEKLEISLMLEFSSFDNLNDAKKKLFEYDKEMQISFIDNMGSL